MYKIISFSICICCLLTGCSSSYDKEREEVRENRLRSSGRAISEDFKKLVAEDSKKRGIPAPDTNYDKLGHDMGELLVRISRGDRLLLKN